MHQFRWHFSIHHPDRHWQYQPNRIQLLRNLFPVLLNPHGLRKIPLPPFLFKVHGYEDLQWIRHKPSPTYQCTKALFAYIKSNLTFNLVNASDIAVVLLSIHNARRTWARSPPNGLWLLIMVHEKVRWKKQFSIYHLSFGDLSWILTKILHIYHIMVQNPLRFQILIQIAFRSAVLI